VSLETSSGTDAGVAEYQFEHPWYQAELIGYKGDLLRQRRLLRPVGV
jgi:hypothetical protein